MAAEFVDPFLLVITLVLTLCLVFGNIYFVAHYSHHADSFFGSSTACKAVLVSCIFPSVLLNIPSQVLGYMLAQG